MGQSVLVVYRHASATIVLAPFAFFLERQWGTKDVGKCPKSRREGSCREPCGMGGVGKKWVECIAAEWRKWIIKISVVKSRLWERSFVLAGAMQMTLYKDPIVKMVWSPHHNFPYDNQTSAREAAKAAIDNKHQAAIVVLLIFPLSP